MIVDSTLNPEASPPLQSAAEWLAFRPEAVPRGGANPDPHQADTETDFDNLPSGWPRIYPGL